MNLSIMEIRSEHVDVAAPCNDSDDIQGNHDGLKKAKNVMMIRPGCPKREDKPGTERVDFFVMIQLFPFT